MTEQDIQKIANTVIDKLEDKNKLTVCETPIKKTEKLLNYYNVFKKKLEKKEELLENIVIKKSSGIAGGGNGSFEFKSELEKKEDKKEKLLDLFDKYEQIIKMVDLALEEIKDDKYYEIIELLYFKKYRWEDVEDELGVDNSCIYRNRKRLITELSFNLFPQQLLS